MELPSADIIGVIAVICRQQTVCFAAVCSAATLKCGQQILVEGCEMDCSNL